VVGLRVATVLALSSAFALSPAFALPPAFATPPAPDDAARLQRLDPGIRARIAALVDSARADSLPGEVLIQRALEGTTKGAPGERIVLAVRALHHRLREARRLLGAGREPDELVAAAGCLAAGVDSMTLHTLSTGSRVTSLTVPLIVLTDLVGRGAAQEVASDVTVRMVGAGLEDQAFLDLRATVQQSLQRGVPASDAVLAGYRALSRGTSATPPSGRAPGSRTDPSAVSPEPAAKTTRSGR
jgi:hypothetical protein